MRYATMMQIWRVRRAFRRHQGTALGRLLWSELDWWKALGETERMAPWHKMMAR